MCAWHLGVKAGSAEQHQRQYAVQMRRELRTGLFKPTTSRLLLALVKPVMKRSLGPRPDESGCMIEIIIGDAIVRLHAGVNVPLLQLVLQSLRHDRLASS